MPDYVIIADDLTGANANCSLMKKLGLNSASVLNIDDYEDAKDIQAIAVTTDSRSMFKKESYDVVIKAMSKFDKEKTTLFNKRIDSTMRGNIGVEVEAMLDSLGDEYMAIAVPVYPATGRIVVNGTMLVNGNLLTNTDAGKDTKSPVNSSNIESVLKKQFSRKIKSIYLEDVEEGEEHIKNIIQKEYKEGTKFLIFDGVTENDLENIANAAVNSKVKYFSVDPGPFTSKIAEIKLDKTDTFSKVLMVVGSVTDITIEQIKELIFTYPVNILKVDALKLATLEDYKDEIERTILEGEKLLEEGNYLLVTTTPYYPNEKRLDLKKVSNETGMSVDDIAIMISNGLGTIASQLLKKDFSFAGVFSSGGDITVQLTKNLEANMIEIKEEIIPLAAYGRIRGGIKPGLRIISKGGMVGDKNAMKLCLEKLKSTLEED